MPLTLQAINRFPVKSCRGEPLQQALVEPWGLAGDRRWMLVDDDGVLLTAREHPRLLLVRPSLSNDGSLDFASPDLPGLHVEVPLTGDLIEVRVWRSELSARLAAGDANAWFSKVIGGSARLVYLDDATRRQPNPRFAQPGDYVSFADGYPLLLTTTASLDAVNELIRSGPRADEVAAGPLPMIRFRPNLVVVGSEPWAEDGWRRIRVGEAQFRVVKGCDRCVITLIDPETGSSGKEPLRTLAKHRRWDGKSWFGMNLIPDTPGATIRLDDEVEVLDSERALDGPPR